MLIGQTSSSCARRRMLSASSPSASTVRSATPRIRSRDRRCCLLPGMYRVLYTVHRTGEVAVRRWVWVALAGQLLFVLSWIVGGALQSGYSHIEQGVSELGAHGAAHPWLGNAGIVAFGLSLAAIGLAVFPVLPARPARGVALALFLGAAAAIVAVALIRLDCPLSDQHCEDMWRAGQLSWHESGHLWASTLGQLLLACTPFAIARALSPGPVAPLAFGAGVSGLVIGVGIFFLYAI